MKWKIIGGDSIDDEAICLYLPRLIQPPKGVVHLIGVTVRSNEPFERALKRFTKSCEKSGIIFDVKNRQRYEKPSEIKKRMRTSLRRKRAKELAEANRKRLY